MKYFTHKQIQAKYDKLNDKEKINVLHDAIGYIQEYNGRSKFLCIAMAMGFRNNEGDDKSYFKI